MLTPMLLNKPNYPSQIVPASRLFVVLRDCSNVMRQQSEVSGSCRQPRVRIFRTPSPLSRGGVRLVSACGAAFSMLNPSKM